MDTIPCTNLSWQSFLKDKKAGYQGKNKKWNIKALSKEYQKEYKQNKAETPKKTDNTLSPYQLFVRKNAGKGKTLKAIAQEWQTQKQNKTASGQNPDALLCNIKQIKKWAKQFYNKTGNQINLVEELQDKTNDWYKYTGEDGVEFAVRTRVKTSLQNDKKKKYKSDRQLLSFVCITPTMRAIGFIPGMSYFTIVVDTNFEIRLKNVDLKSKITSSTTMETWIEQFYNVEEELINEGEIKPKVTRMGYSYSGTDRDTGMTIINDKNDNLVSYPTYNVQLS